MGRKVAADALRDRWPSLGIVARAVVYRHPSKREIADVAIDAYLSRVFPSRDGTVAVGDVRRWAERFYRSTGVWPDWEQIERLLISPASTGDREENDKRRP
jgi:hypothetical protein